MNKRSGWEKSWRKHVKPFGDPRIRNFLDPRHTKNSLVPALGVVVQVASAFIVTPVAFAKLGEEQLGIFVLLTVLLGFGGMLTFGGGDATLRLVAKYRALNRPNRVSEIAGTSHLFFIAVGVFGGVGIASLAEILSEGVFKTSNEVSGLAAQSFLVGSWALPFLLPAQAIKAVLNGYERLDLGASVQMVLSVIEVTGQLILLVNGWGLLSLAGWMVTVRALTFMTFLAVARRCLPSEVSLLPRWKWDAIKETLSFGIYIWIGGVFNKIWSEGLPLVLGAILGAGAVGAFSLASKPVTAFVQVLQRGTSFLYPYLTGLYERGQQQQLMTRFRIASSVVVILSSSFCAVLVFLAEPLVNIWLGETAPAEVVPLIRILAIRFAVHPLSVVVGQLMRAANRGRMIVLVQIISCVPLLTATVVGAKVGGLIGAAWAQYIVFAVLLFNRVLIERSVFGKARIGFQIQLLAGAILPASIACWIALDRSHPFWVWLAWGSTIAVASALLSALIVYPGGFLRLGGRLRRSFI